MYDERVLGYANYKPKKGIRSHNVVMPKDWVVDYYLNENGDYIDEPSSIVSKKSWPWVYVGREGQSIVILPATIGLPSNLFVETINVHDQFEQLDFGSSSLSRKAEVLSYLLLGAFLQGCDEVKLMKSNGHEDAIRHAVELFRPGFAITSGVRVIDKINFENAPNLIEYDSIRSLYGVIVELLTEINGILKRALQEFNETNDPDILHKCKMELINNFDVQTELYMWTVLRKIIKDIGFRGKKREELSNNAFYIVLGADAKLLERYKDNYLEIIDAFQKYKLPNTYALALMGIMDKTLIELLESVKLLLATAYGESEKSTMRQNAMKIMRECDEIEGDIKHLETTIMNDVLLSVGVLNESSYKQIYGYSRIVDRMNRHLKRVRNILESALFTIPQVN